MPPLLPGTRLTLPNSGSVPCLSTKRGTSCSNWMAHSITGNSDGRGGRADPSPLVPRSFPVLSCAPLSREVDLADERWSLTSHSRHAVRALVAPVPSRYVSSREGARLGHTKISVVTAAAAARNPSGGTVRTLRRIAGRYMDMTVAIRPASLWTHALFAVVADLDKSGLCSVDLTHDSRADLVGEFKQWLSITTSSQEGPWQRARYFAVALAKGLSDTSLVARGGVVNTTSGTVPPGGVFPPDWWSNLINQNDMYALYHLLRQFCTRHPNVLRRAQVLIDVDNQSVMEVFNPGRVKNPSLTCCCCSCLRCNLNTVSCHH